MKMTKRLVSFLLVFSMISSMFLAVNAAETGAKASERTGITVEYEQTADVYGEAVTHTKGYYMTDKKLEALPVTYEAWVYIPSSVYNTASGVILGTQWDAWDDTWNGAGSGDVHFSFGIKPGGHPTLVYGTKGNKQVWEATGKGVIPADTWTHVVMEHDTREGNKHVWCFINAGGAGGWDTYEKVGKGAGLLELDSSALDNPVFLAGDSFRGNSHALDSGIVLGDVAVYSDLRSASGGEVKYDYENGADLTDPNLILYYQISSANQNKDIKDASGHGYDMNFYRTFLTEAEMSEIRAKDKYDYSYSIAFLPDLQYMTNRFPAKVGNIFDYLVDTKDEKNLQYVVGLGDITDKDAQWEWNVAKAQYALLDAAGIPYTLVRGNHDIYTTDKVMFDQTFGKNSEYYKHVAANGGFYDTSSATNAYVRFEVGSVKYLILCLDWGIKDTKVLDWADKVMADHPDRRVIVTMHAWMNSDATIFENGDWALPSSYNSANINPQQMWNNYFAKRSNIDMIVCGHMHSDNIFAVPVQGTNGNTVYQILIDSQASDLSVANGGYNGLGLVAYMYFTADGNHAKIEYYSTTYNRYYYEKNTEISLDFGTSDKFIEADGTPLVPNSKDNANWTTVDGKLFLKDSINHSLLRFENELNKNRVEATISTSTAAHKTALDERGNIRDGIIFAVSDDGSSYYWAFVNAWNVVEVMKMSEWKLMTAPENNCGGTGGVSVSSVASEFTLAVEWDNNGNIKVYVNDKLIHNLKDSENPLTGKGYGLRSVKGVASNNTGSYYTSIIAGVDDTTSDTPIIPDTPEQPKPPVYNNFKDAAGNVLNPYFVNEVIWDNNNGNVFLPAKPGKGFLLFDNKLANNRVEATIVVKDNMGSAEGSDGNKRAGIVFALTDHDGDATFNSAEADVSYYWAFINNWGHVELRKMGRYQCWTSLGSSAASISNVTEGVKLAAEWDNQGHIRIYANGELVINTTDTTDPLSGTLYGLLAVKHYNYASNPALVNSYYTSFVAGGELTPDAPPPTPPTKPDSYDICVDNKGNLLNPYFVNDNIWTEVGNALTPAPGPMENFLLFDTPLTGNRIEATFKDIPINNDGNTRNGIVFALTDIQGDHIFDMANEKIEGDVSYYFACISGWGEIQLISMGGARSWDVYLTGGSADVSNGLTLAVEWDAQGNVKVFANGKLCIDKNVGEALTGNLYGVLMRSYANTADAGFTHKHTLTSFVAGKTVNYQINASASSAEGGSVTGAGEYEVGATVTLKATADTGYKFTGWYNGESKVSSNETYTFTAAENLTLTAKFEKLQPTIEITTTDSDIVYTVEGNTVKVSYELACKVGYLSGGKYVALTATANGDGSYSYTVPEGVTSIVVVVKGDLNGDGKITLADSTKARAAYSNKTTLGALDAFAGDVNGDGSITLADSTKIRATYSNKTTIAW